MLDRLNRLYPVRYTVLGLCVLGLLACVFSVFVYGVGTVPLLLLLALVGVGVYDLLQPRRSVLRNYPIIGHIRYMLEYVRPEIRQYFLESDTEATPFSRAQRSLVYQRAKGDSDKRPFGTLLDVHAEGYEWMNHSMAPSAIASHDFRVWIGGTPEQLAAQAPGAGLCTQPYHASVFNISAMSFGSLSANAILALNAGAQQRRLCARHRRRLDLGAPPAPWRRPDLGDRLGLLRLPQRRRQFQPREVCTERLRPAGQDDRDQAQPGRQARSWRRSARAQGHVRKLRRRAAYRLAWTASRRRRTVRFRHRSN